MPRMPCSRVMTRYGQRSRSPSMHDFRDRDAKPPAKLRQRTPLRDELMAQQRRKNLQHQPRVERDDEIGAGREQMRIPVRQPMSRARCRAPPAGIATASARQAWKASIFFTLGSECMIGDRFRKPVVSREVRAPLTGPGWRARTGAAAGCRARPRNPSRLARISCR